MEGLLRTLMLWESLKRIFVHNNNGSLGWGSPGRTQQRAPPLTILPYSAKFQQSYSVTPYGDDQSPTPPPGFEPGTRRLTVVGSTAELQRIVSSTNMVYTEAPCIVEDIY